MNYFKHGCYKPTEWKLYINLSNKIVKTLGKFLGILTILFDPHLVEIYKIMTDRGMGYKYVSRLLLVVKRTFNQKLENGRKIDLNSASPKIYGSLVSNWVRRILIKMINPDLIDPLVLGLRLRSTDTRFQFNDPKTIVPTFNFFVGLSKCLLVKMWPIECCKNLHRIVIINSEKKLSWLLFVICEI